MQCLLQCFSVASGHQYLKLNTSSSDQGVWSWSFYISHFLSFSFYSRSLMSTCIFKSRLFHTKSQHIPSGSLSWKGQLFISLQNQVLHNSPSRNTWSIERSVPSFVSPFIAMMQCRVSHFSQSVTSVTLYNSDLYFQCWNSNVLCGKEHLWPDHWLQQITWPHLSTTQGN